MSFSRGDVLIALFPNSDGSPANINIGNISETLAAKKIGQLSAAQMQKLNDCLKAALDVS